MHYKMESAILHKSIHFGFPMNSGHGMRAFLLAGLFFAATPGISHAGDLPSPTGRYPVGLRAFELHDPSRTNAPASREAPRAIASYIFYPAAPGAKAGRSYITDADILIPSMARNFHYDVESLARLRDARAHSAENAAPAPGHFPVVFFSHGLPLYALQSTTLLEEVASHGYVVVAITHPGDAVDHKLADGRIIPTIELQTKQAYSPAKQRMNYADNFADRVAAVPEYSRLLAPTRIGESAVAWRQDALFALQSVEDGAVPAPVADVLRRQADLKKVAMTGMSFGGDVAAGACHATPVCKAAINLDGGPYDTTLFNRALDRPLLMVMSDWIDLPLDSHPFPEGYHPDDLQFERWTDAGLSPDIFRVRIKNIRHMALSDLPYLMQGPGREAALGTADPQSTGAALSHLVLAFLDTYLKGAPRSGVVHVLARYSDILGRHDPKALRDWARKNPTLAVQN